MMSGITETGGEPSSILEKPSGGALKEEGSYLIGEVSGLVPISDLDFQESSSQLLQE